jgi:hypothetical protein
MKGDIRKMKRKTTKIEVLEISIAGLRVMTSSALENGVMVVSVKEGERLQKMVDDASSRDTQKKIQERVKDNETTEEGN